MSETVTIKSFEPGNDWSSDDGKIALTFYECVFDRNGNDFKATWNKKQGTGDPPLNEPIEGEFTEKKPGDWRFRKASKPGGGSTGSRNFKSKEFKPESQFDPEKTARIGRAHAQHMAILTLAAMGLFESVSATQIESKLFSWVDVFAKDVDKAGEAAKQAQGATHKSTGTPAPGASSGPASQPAGPTVAEVTQALDTAGLYGPAASTVALYLVANLEAPRLVTAVQKLTGSDLEAQAFALKTAEELAVKGTGEPLPEIDPADEIPF